MTTREPLPSPTVLSRVGTMIRTSAGLGLRDLGFTFARLGILAAGRATLPLDHLFYGAHRRVPIERPVFILGHPRSGTTFLHRLLTCTDEHPAFRTWELLVPSLTARKLIRPLLPALVRVLGKGLHDDTTLFAEDAHEVRVDSVEEEELLLLFALNTQFLLLFTALGFAEADPWDLVFPDRQSAARRRASMALLRGCLQRQILATGCPRVVAKMPYSTLRARTLLEAFPDARFVYLVRSPLETIPSHLSLHRHMFRQVYGLENLSPDLLARYWDRRYRFNVELYRYFREVEMSGDIPAEQLLVVRYPELRSDLEGVFRRVTEFAGLAPSEALRARVAEQSARQASYSRGHTNLRVEDFGIATDRVLADLGWVFDRYGLPQASPTPSLA